MLGISFGPWLHAKAISDIKRHFTQFLKSKTSVFDDFGGFKVSKALQTQDLLKNQNFEINALRSWELRKFSNALRLPK